MSCRLEKCVEEFMIHCEEMLKLSPYHHGDPWINTIAAGIDLLSSLSLAAIATDECRTEARCLMEADLASFFDKLLSIDHGPGGKTFADAILYPNK